MMVMSTRHILTGTIVTVGIILVLIGLTGTVLMDGLNRNHVQGVMLVRNHSREIMLYLVGGFDRHRCRIDHDERDAERRHQPVQDRDGRNRHLLALNRGLPGWQVGCANAGEAAQMAAPKYLRLCKDCSA